MAGCSVLPLSEKYVSYLSFSERQVCCPHFYPYPRSDHPCQRGHLWDLACNTAQVCPSSHVGAVAQLNVPSLINNLFPITLLVSQDSCTKIFFSSVQFHAQDPPQTLRQETSGRLRVLQLYLLFDRNPEGHQQINKG